jgi:D-xylose transport system permease protein
MSAATAPPPAADPDAPAANTIRAYADRWWTDVKSGELGSLPIVVGLIIIAIIFQTQNDRFLTAGNFVNLIVQTAPYAVIAMGVTFALLLGEIDLSIGFVSGVGGVLTAILLTPDKSVPPTWLVMVIVLAVGLGIGTFHGLIITKVGVPSFVVTLAGLLAWNGVVLLLIGSKGTVILQNDIVIGLANNFLKTGDAWIIMLVTLGIYAAVQLLSLRSRKASGLPTDPPLIVGLRIAALGLALAAVVWICNKDRGVPVALLIVGALFVIWTYVLNRTKFGRHIYAVGGNAEAARRAGINVDNVRIACFAIVSMMAVIGGIILASRLRSVDTNTGGGQALLYPIAAAVIAAAR